MMIILNSFLIQKLNDAFFLLQKGFFKSALSVSPRVQSFYEALNLLSRAVEKPLIGPVDRRGGVVDRYCVLSGLNWALNRKCLLHFGFRSRTWLQHILC